MLICSKFATTDKTRVLPLLWRVEGWFHSSWRWLGGWSISGQCCSPGVRCPFHAWCSEPPSPSAWSPWDQIICPEHPNTESRLPSPQSETSFRGGDRPPWKKITRPAITFTINQPNSSFKSGRNCPRIHRYNNLNSSIVYENDLTVIWVYSTVLMLTCSCSICLHSVHCSFTRRLSPPTFSWQMTTQLCLVLSNQIDIQSLLVLKSAVRFCPYL